MTAQKKLPRYTYTVPTLDDRADMIDWIRKECLSKKKLNDAAIYRKFGTQNAISRLQQAGYMTYSKETDLHTFTDYKSEPKDIASLVWSRSGKKQLCIIFWRSNF